MDYLVLSEHCGRIADVICGDRATAADCGDRSVAGEPRKVVDGRNRRLHPWHRASYATCRPGRTGTHGNKRQEYSVNYLASVATTTGERRGVAASPGRIARGNAW